MCENKHNDPSATSDRTTLSLDISGTASNNSVKLMTAVHSGINLLLNTADESLDSVLEEYIKTIGTAAGASGDFNQEEELLSLARDVAATVIKLRETIQKNAKYEEARKHRRDIPDWLVVKTGSVQWEVNVDHELGVMHPDSHVDWRAPFSAMFGLDKLEPVLKAWTDLIHPDDIPELTDVIVAHLSDPTGEAKYDHDYRAKVKLSDGTAEWQWFNAKGSTHWENGLPQYIAGILSNIHQHKEKEFEDIYRRKLRAVRNEVAELLLGIDMNNYHEKTQQAMKAVAEAFDVNRVYLWKNHESKDDIFCSQVLEAVVGTSSQQENRKISQNISYNDHRQWKEFLLEKGISINCLVCDMPDAERIHSNKQGILSMAIIPVDAEGRRWGFFGVDNCMTECRIFKDYEVQSISNIGATFTQSYLRYERILENFERDRLNDAVRTASAILLEVQDDKKFEDATHQAFEVVAKAMNVDRICIGETKVEQGDMIYSELYAWPRESRVAEITNIAYSTVPNWWSRLLSGEAINETLSEMSEKERKYAIQNNIKAMLEAPIIIDGTLWGTVSFDKFHDEQLFSEVDVSIQKSVGDVFAHAIRSNDARRAERLQRESAEAARLQAEAANKAKSEFIGRMNHEIRNPMNAVINMAELGLSAPDSEVNRKNYTLSKIQESGEYVLDVINDVLDMSKIESGILELNPDSTDIEKTVLKTEEIIRQLTFKKNQNFTVNIDKRIPKLVWIDGHRLSQVMQNLLTNASKFTSEGGSIELSVNLLHKNKGDCKFQLKVKDSGIGIDYAAQERIFEPFVQEKASISRTFGGTGLGLAITKSIVDLMGGSITLQSKQGEGSEFCVTFDAKKVGKIRDMSHINDESSFNYHGRTILVAEDTDINREIMEYMLRKTNASTVFVKNGQQAVQAFLENPEKYDMIFMDILMPEMDGYEATKAIRSSDHPKAKSVPIVAMTANVLKEDVEKCFAVGMNDHMGKPFNAEAVLTAMRRALGE